MDGNALGAMLFVTGGFVLGYWVLDGRATAFLQSIKGGVGGGQPAPTPPIQLPGTPGNPDMTNTGGGGWGAIQHIPDMGNAGGGGYGGQTPYHAPSTGW